MKFVLKSVAVALFAMGFSSAPSYQSAYAASDGCIYANAEWQNEDILNNEELRVTIENSCQESIRVKVCISKNDGTWSYIQWTLDSGSDNYWESYNPTGNYKYYWEENSGYIYKSCDDF